MTGDLMPLLDDRPKQLRMLASYDSESEEGRSAALTLEELEQDLSMLDDPALRRSCVRLPQAVVVGMVPVLKVNSEDGLSGNHSRRSPGNTQANRSPTSSLSAKANSEAVWTSPPGQRMRLMPKMVDSPQITASLPERIPRKVPLEP